MRSLFRAFEAGGVEYLVISGQAAVLYGGAYFSQDLDLWIRPAAANTRRFLLALARLHARVHRLTPPLTQRNLRRGHGFHFLVPQKGEADLYLDVMGRPPRVRGFTRAARRRETPATPWGTIPVVSIEDLVEIKKTNRPSDYDVISRLALIRVGRDDPPRPAVLRWALRNIFKAEDLWELVRLHRTRLGGVSLPRAARVLLRAARAGREPKPSEWNGAAKALAAEALRLQERGRAYWTPFLEELREWRSGGRLLPERAPVSDLLRFKPERGYCR